MNKSNAIAAVGPGPFRKSRRELRPQRACLGPASPHPVSTPIRRTRSVCCARAPEQLCRRHPGYEKGFAPQPKMASLIR